MNSLLNISMATLIAVNSTLNTPAILAETAPINDGVSICSITSYQEFETYMDANKSFYTWYDQERELMYDEIGFKYKDLCCSSSNATLKTKITANTSLITLKTYTEVNCLGINPANSTVWYGYTWNASDRVIDSDIEEANAVKFTYTISNNNGSYITNDPGEWIVYSQQ